MSGAGSQPHGDGEARDVDALAAAVGLALPLTPYATAAPSAVDWREVVGMLEALPAPGSDPVGEALAALDRLPAATRARLVVSLASGEAPAKRLARAWKDADPDIRRLFLARVTGRTT